MKSPVARSLDMIAIRAAHDADMRDLLRDQHIDPRGTISDLRQRLADLDPRQVDTLLEKNNELEERTGRPNAAYQALSERTQKLWMELIKPHEDQAGKLIETDMRKAYDALAAENNERFEMYLDRFKSHGEEMSKAMVSVRTEVRRDIRAHIFELGLQLDTQTRATLVDQMSRQFTVPPSMDKVMGASNELEDAKSQMERERELNRALGYENAPSPSPRM